MRLVLITGAGASRNLQVDGSEPIVLMDGWAAALREQFGPALSELLGLHGVVTGQDFEEHLGALTRWLELMALNERFSWMTSGTDDGRDGHVNGFVTALEHAKRRGQRFESSLDSSLFAQFGPSRFDTRRAAGAYAQLLGDLRGKTPGFELVCATTNYDRSLEDALRADGIGQVRIGMTYDGIRKPTLSAAGLGDFGPTPSVLYLHGAVGWRRRDDGTIEGQSADEDEPALGRPAVLYPSNDKVVEESIVAELWRELERALGAATHVLVLGHGLADTHLVDRLANVKCPLAVTYFTDDDAAKAAEQLPDARRLHVAFGPAPKYDRPALKAWAAGR